MGIGGTEIVITRYAEGGVIGQGLAVMKGTAANQVKLPTGAGVRATGVTMLGAAAAGEAIPIVVAGPTQAIAGGAINPDDFVKVGGTNGRLVATTNANDEVVGRALSSAGTNGDEFSLLVQAHKY